MGPSAFSYSVGVPEEGSYAAEYPARTFPCQLVVAEFAGYWLHRLLHSDKFPALSRGHLIHHFLIYGPRQSMRAGGYLDATDNRTSVGNVGVEWLAPSAIILLFCWGAMALLGVPLR